MPTERHTGVARTRPAEAVGRRRIRLITDGGAKEGCEHKQRRLQRLFIDVTGVDRLVEPQECEDGSRVLDENTDSDGLSEYLTAMAREDGLSETVAEPDQGGDLD